MKRLHHFSAVFVLLVAALVATPAPNADAMARSQLNSTTTTPEDDMTTRTYTVAVTSLCDSAITVANADDSGPGSLRQAINDVCVGGTITFDGDYEITLASQLEVSKNLTIDGVRYSIEVSGNDAVRVFDVTAGTVTLSNLTIRNGANSPAKPANTGGGGLYIANAGTAVTLNNCAVINNSLVTNVVGGGVVVAPDSSLTMNNCTVSGNSAADVGGIFNGGTLQVNSSTIAKNAAGPDGWVGGIESTPGSTTTIRNSIIAGNTGTVGPDCYTVSGTTIQSGGYNQVGTTTNCSFTSVGSDVTDFSFGSLGLDETLKDNGGITFTHALLPGSPAIDAIPGPNCNSAPSSDQRGVVRPQGGACDIGAYEQHSPVRYANPAGLTVGACDSWASACELSYALDYAVSGQEIWVAAGRYTPTSGADWGISFALKNGVGVYGGFDGTETLREQRDWVANETILSGDLNGDDASFTNNEENSYHVVVVDEVDNVILDGFTISGGNASMPLPNVWGGGMFVVGASPTVRNVVFTNNTAQNGGGGLTAFHSSLVLENVVFEGNEGGAMVSHHPGTPSLTNVIFKNNTGGGLNLGDHSDATLIDVTFSGNSAEYGGGMTVGGGVDDGSHPILINVTFSGNSATYDGGGMWIEKDTFVELTHVTFSGNSALGKGGGIYNQSKNNYPLVKNSIFWGNTAGSGIAPQIFNDDVTLSTVDTSIVEGGCPYHSTCSNVITADPQLGNLGNYGGFTETIPLLTGSSAIDATDGSSCPAEDQRGITRPHDGDHDGNAICDIGAYEVTTTLTVSSIVRASADPTSAASVDFTVTFSEKVTDVDAGDFHLTVTNLPGAAITGVNGSGTTYTVSVKTGTVGSLNGSIRLDVVDNDSIRDIAGNRLGGPGAGNGNFTVGPSYTIAGHVSRPTYLTPPSSYITDDSTPTFSWGAVVDAARYKIEFASNNVFTPIVDFYFVDDPTFTPDTPMANGKYYWRVHAYNIVNEPGAGSGVRSITIDTLEPAAPVLQSPAHDVTVRTVPTFRWKAVNDAVLYQFQLDNDDDLTSPVVSVTQRALSRKPAGGLRGTYYWRVRARDAAGNWSQWSPVFAVTIQARSRLPGR